MWLIFRFWIIMAMAPLVPFRVDSSGLTDTFVHDELNATRIVPAEISSRILQRVTLMSVFMVIALVGNITVLSILWKSRAWKRPVSLFIISLAISDILIAIFSMSTEVFWEVFGGWIFGNALCKCMTYIQCILFASTAFIHMSISFDRYEAICKPMLFSKRTIRNRRMIKGSWILAVLIALPQLFIFLEVETGEREDGSRIYACKSAGYTAEWQRKVYVSWIALYVFLVPVVTISFCYIKIACAVWRYDLAQKRQQLLSTSCTQSDFSTGRVHFAAPEAQRVVLSRAKMKTIQVTVCILASYTFCWTPYFTVSLLNVWTDYAYRDVISTAPIYILAQCLCWFSSCVNPIIYGCFNMTSRLDKVTCHFRRKKTGAPPATDLLKNDHWIKVPSGHNNRILLVGKEGPHRSPVRAQRTPHDVVIFHTHGVRSCPPLLISNESPPAR